MIRARKPAHPSAAVVLIVEDDDIVAMAAADVIGSMGYRAVWARDGWQALDALERERPTMMLVDLSLPGMSGSEFLRSVRRTPSWSDIPRFIMTGTNDSMIGVREDTAVFYKPFDMDALMQVVERHCGGTGRQRRYDRPAMKI
jgi:two-component system, sensor histidine kinase ChiS